MTTPIFSATGSTQAEARAVIDADSPAERDAAITAALVAYDWKPAVRVRAQAAVALGGPGANIDGTGMVAGDRFLTNVQGGALPGTTNAANGLYVWNGAAVAATRATDFALGSDAGGAAVKVNEGTDADKIFVCITDTTVGNAIAFQQSGFVGAIDNTTHGALGYQTPTPAQHHATAVAATSPGFMSAADKSKIDAYAATYGAGRVLRGSGAAYADSTATYPDTVVAGDLVCATGAGAIGVVAGPGATVSVLKHTGSGGTNLPAHISLAGAGVDAYKLLQANAGGTDFVLDMLTDSGHAGLGFQTLAAAQHHSNAVAGVSPGFMSAADKTKVDALPTVMAFCGTGADGAAVLMAAGGGTVPAGMVDDGGGAYHLTRDVNTTTFMQEAGSVLQTRGFFLRCSTSLWTEGTIHANGAAGANAGAGGGAGGAAGAVGTLRSGTAGGNGNNAGAGAAGAADVTGLGSAGGAGGAGGNNIGANAGGAAGAVTAPTAVMGDWQNAWAALLSFLPGYNAGVTAWPQGGSGGGGGGSGVTNVGTTSNGGGGGAGGGILKIAAPTFTVSGVGVLSANGGAGGNGGDGTAGNDDGGGGGGGGGGGVALVFRTTYTGNIPTATGGAPGGHGHLMPAGAGADGVDGTIGTAGLVIQFTV